MTELTVEEKLDLWNKRKDSGHWHLNNYIYGKEIIINKLNKDDYAIRSQLILPVDDLTESEVLKIVKDKNHEVVKYLTEGLNDWIIYKVKYQWNTEWFITVLSN